MENRKLNSGKYSKLFLVVVSIFGLLFVGYLFYAKHTLSKSQERIIAVYTSHLERVDSMYVNLYNYIQNTMDNTVKRSEDIIIDSIINNYIIREKGLTESQYKVLYSVISSYFEQQQLASNQFSCQIHRDSLILGAERLVLNGQIKNHLDLHLSQIENDYTSITIWAAVLTIVFLIFGFYSMFKMEHLIEHGEKSNEAIDAIKKECIDHIEQIKNSKKTFESQYGDIISTLNNNILSRMESLDKEIEIRINRADIIISQQAERMSHSEAEKSN